MQDPAVTTEATRGSRSSDEAPRMRLLHSGVRLFAAQGFAKTSTRELAEAAGVNIASISYYFGDKAGLYRAAFLEPAKDLQADLAQLSDPGIALPQALGHLYAGFLSPLRQGDDARLCMKLHFREMLEPTGLWEEEINHTIKPMQDALLGLLCRHFGLKKPDDELKRLAICLCGLGVHLHVGHDVINTLAPQLNEGPDVLDLWSDRLVMYALAMIDAEKARRQSTTAKKGRST
jgi:AcrR family transcriptional regulator